MIGVEIIENVVEDVKVNVDLNGEFVYVVFFYSFVLFLMDCWFYIYSFLLFFLNCF